MDQRLSGRRFERVPLRDITPARINEWKTKRRREADDLAATKRTISSVLRNSKSLFNKKHLSEMGFGDLENPFEQVSIEGSTIKRFRTKLKSPKELMDKAALELAVPVPDSGDWRDISVAKSKNQCFRILVLLMATGMRREELDALTWEQIDFENKILSVYSNEFDDIKTETSDRDIDLADEIIDLLLQWKIQTKGPFVVESKGTLSRDSNPEHYRCRTHFGRLSKWLRENGVDAIRPLHHLRAFMVLGFVRHLESMRQVISLGMVRFR